MSELAVIDRLRRDAFKVPTVVVPRVMIRGLGALLALAVATAHVADQGGVTLFSAPDWLGWAYRLIEVGGVLTALALAWPRAQRMGWSAGVVLGALPFLGYLVSRTVGVPGAAADVGNWGDWAGTIALLVEAALVALSVAMLLAPEPASARPESPGRPTEEPGAVSMAEAWSLWLPMNLK